MSCRRIVFVLALMLCAAGSFAQTQLAIDVGWDNLYRIGRWNPVFITAADPVPQQVGVEIYAPHDSHYAMRLTEGITIDANPRTVPLYLPLSNSLEQASVTVRSAVRETVVQTLADSEITANGARTQPQVVDDAATFVGLSGAASTMPMIRGQFQAGQM